MSATNSTTNYNLPQFVGSDKPTWLGDFNGAMNTIDGQMKTNNDLGNTAKTTADTASTNASTALTNASTAQTTADTANATANSALTKATTNEGNISTLSTEVTDMKEYSTTTEKVVGKWIDGKPIYRKVVSMGNLSSNTGAISVNHNISDIDSFTKIYGWITNDTEWIPFNSVYRGTLNQTMYDLGLLANKTSIIYTTQENRSNYKGFIILEYTKTTDVVE